MPRFVIDLGDIDMSPDAQAALNGDLQKVALGHIAGMKFEKPVALRFPHEWLGLIMRRDFEHVFRAEKELDAVIGEIRVGGSR